MARRAESAAGILSAIQDMVVCRNAGTDAPGEGLWRLRDARGVTVAMALGLPGSANGAPSS